MTAQEIIQDALIEIGVIPAGGYLGTADLAWALRKFNTLLQTLSADGFNINYFVSENFSLVSGTGSYTIGSGGDFNTARPGSIQKAWIRESGIDYPIDIRPMHEYYDLANKAISDRPVFMTYNNDYTLGVIYFDRVPNDTYDFHIVSKKPFASHLSSTEVDLPQEYNEMLISNLAVSCASRYGKPLSQELKQRAKETLRQIKNNNINITPVNTNFLGSIRGYDIAAG